MHFPLLKLRLIVLLSDYISQVLVDQSVSFGVSSVSYLDLEVSIVYLLVILTGNNEI